MANKYAVASGSWSSTSVWSDSDGGASGATVPAAGDAVFISAGVSVLMDTDYSGGAGLLTVTIRGGDPPGMLYYMDGTDGHLKIQAGYQLVGTTSTNRGRLLANSDGVWGNTGALSSSNSAVISLVTTAYVNAQDLDVALYAHEPTVKYVTTYKVAYDFDNTDVTAATDYIDLGVTPPINGTPVMVHLVSGTLPAGLIDGEVYWTGYVSGNSVRLCQQFYNQLYGVVDITDAGSGSFQLLTGCASADTTLYTLEDVSSDADWSTTSGENLIVVVDNEAANYDQQRTTLSSKGAGSITLGNALDSAQMPGARVYMRRRNVAIRSTATGGTNFIAFGTNSGSPVLNCEISNTSATGTTFPTYAVQGSSLTSLTLGAAAMLSGVNRGVYLVPNVTLSGIIGVCSVGSHSGTGYTVTASGQIVGCATGLQNITNLTLSGTIWGSSAGVAGAVGTFTFDGLIHAGYSALLAPNASSTIDLDGGTIVRCIYAMNGYNTAAAGWEAVNVTFRDIQTVFYNCRYLNITNPVIDHAYYVFSGSSICTLEASMVTANVHNVGTILNTANGCRLMAKVDHIGSISYGSKQPLVHVIGTNVTNVDTVGSGGFFSGHVVAASGTTSAFNSCAPSGVRGLEIEDFTNGFVSCYTGGIYEHMTFTNVSTPYSYYNQNFLRIADLFLEYNGDEDQIRAWAEGGTMTHETVEVPSGKSYSHKITFSSPSSDIPFYIDFPLAGALGNTLSFTVHAKHDSTGLSADERITWALVHPGADPMLDTSASYLDSWTAADSTSWQSDTVSYTRTDDGRLYLRLIAYRSSGNAYVYVEEDGGGTPASGGGSYAY